VAGNWSPERKRKQDFPSKVLFSFPANYSNGISPSLLRSVLMFDENGCRGVGPLPPATGAVLATGLDGRADTVHYSIDKPGRAAARRTSVVFFGGDNCIDIAQSGSPGAQLTFPSPFPCLWAGF
jgi:hypothetical protein